MRATSYIRANLQNLSLRLVNMTTSTEIQTLLRFLSQDAKVPLSAAMSKIEDLRKASLTSPALIAKSNLGAIQSIFSEDKIAKQVLDAAKRVAKKRSSGETQPESPSKRKKLHSAEELTTPAAIEESLALPSVVATDEELANTILYTNRAPLTLAFAVTLLKYTMPEQPLSSRLSLAQAVVAANSHSKAVSLGIKKVNSEEQKAWGQGRQGQPQVQVMGRRIRVMRRWDYEWREEDHKKEEAETVQCEQGTPGSESLESPGIQENSGAKEPNTTDHRPPLWGLNLDYLRSSNTASISKLHDEKSSAIFTPQAARNYLLTSFGSVPSSSAPLIRRDEKEHSLALLLRALDLLHTSWSQALGTEELDRRSWDWYVAVRPEVESGVAGWGSKGNVKLTDILQLRR